MPAILDSLPALYRALLPDFFGTVIPEETKATCSNCAMCESSATNVVDSADGKSHLFNPATKCCTYQPRLPNYLVGALLEDFDPVLAEGRRRVEARIDSRVGVTPLWVKPPHTFNVLYGNAKGAFGRAVALRCPYYEETKGNCTIWRYREAVCSTWFCKYVAGADGRKMWTSVKTFLSLCELQLSRHAAFELIPEYVVTGKDRAEAGSDKGPLAPEDLDSRAPDEKSWKAQWGSWAGREREYYRACAELVRGLSQEQVMGLLGLDGKIELATLERNLRNATAPKLPERLQFNPAATVKWLADGSVGLGAYSDFDALALPGAAYELLVQFNGREPVGAVREKLRRERGADLSEEVLLELYRHRVLTDA